MSADRKNIGKYSRVEENDLAAGVLFKSLVDGIQRDNEGSDFGKDCLDSIGTKKDTFRKWAFMRQRSCILIRGTITDSTFSADGNKLVDGIGFILRVHFSENLKGIETRRQRRERLD